MKPRVAMDKVAKGLGGARRGPIKAKSGYFGAAELATEAAERGAGGRARPRELPAPQLRRVLPVDPSPGSRLLARSSQIAPSWSRC